MIGLEIQFLTGRYHATPWNRHPNEGGVAWPPHPWQLLRALVATWHLKAPELPLEDVRALIDALAQQPPQYVLPPTTAGHTRHYMPLANDKTTLLIDAFLHVGREARLMVAWPDVTLTPAQRQALDTLAERMAYVGRAESWAQVTACDLSPDALPWNAKPLKADAQAPDGAEVVTVLSPLSPQAFGCWRQGVLAGRQQQKLAENRAKAAQQGKPIHNLKLSPSELRKLEANLPQDLWDALQASTTEAREAGWSLMPGAQWVRYAYTPAAPAPRLFVPARAPTQPPTVARYALSAPVLPSLKRAVFVGERIHRALVERLCKLIAKAPAQRWSAEERAHAMRIITGKDEDGSPLSDHSHLYILPESHGRRGQITHLTLYTSAQAGISALMRHALEKLVRLYRRDEDVRLTLLGVGTPKDFGGLSERDGQSPLLAEARVWESWTPFVATRHAKPPKVDASGDVIGSPRHDLRRLLSLWLQAHVPTMEAASVEISPLNTDRKLHWLDFYTERKGGKGARGHSAPQGFQITFPQPVRGPLAFGYGAHLGLGAFRAVS